MAAGVEVETGADGVGLFVLASASLNCEPLLAGVSDLATGGSTAGASTWAGG